MLITFFVLFLTCAEIKSFSSFRCEHNVGKELSKTRCIAGRRFFARLDKSPTFRNIFSRDTLIQSYAFPWSAQVISSFDGVQNLCGGALINDRFVLTVQTCCSPPLKPSNLEVILGYTNKKIDSGFHSGCAKQLNVINIILHPEYHSNIESSHNNIALLELQPIKYAKTIYPVQLPSNLDKYIDLTNRLVESAGYQTQKISVLNNFKMSAMEIIDNRNCRIYDQMYPNVKDSEHFCCTSKENVEPMCSPVPGTPLLMEKTQGMYNITILLGIASWSSSVNFPCAVPIIYVRIDKKLPWILENTRDALYCNN